MASIHVPTLASETVAHIGSFEIRNTLLMAWLAMGVLALIGLRLKAAGYKLIPGRFQMAMELIIEALFNFFNGIFGDEKITRKFFPLVASIFLFILIANWMGILPGVGSILITAEHNGGMATFPLLRSMNADVNMTLLFAMVAIFTAQVVGIVTLGFFHHAGKYFVAPWKKPYGIGMFVGLLEFLGEFSRIVSFAFRLYGNIFAGEVLLIVISFLVPYIVPIPFLGLELFVGVIQAMVFSMLTAVFLKMAMESHGDHDSAHA
jgi:F-type H+-transporting ATPase subunit a